MKNSLWKSIWTRYKADHEWMNEWMNEHILKKILGNSKQGHFPSSRYYIRIVTCINNQCGRSDVTSHYVVFYTGKGIVQV